MAIEPLPIDNFLPQIVEKLRSAGALVLRAEPGAGKTTRVPPAILDAGLANLQDGRPGQIVVLQPRRVAARAAASRISAERGTALGAETGYQVRFDKRASRNTRILVCTEGVFLRQLQDDPLLQNTAAIIFDEFHERSANSDLALAMVSQVRRDVRPDLRVVVMSATLDAGPVTSYLGGCPSVECPGRTFPIEIEYSQMHSSQTLERGVAAGTMRMLSRTKGHVLVFLPGVSEIRRTQSELEMSSALDDALVLPLYGDMPLEDQHEVLLPSDRRKIVLATNVAETSITIDGVTAVVDSGLCRINRLDPRLGMNRLEVSRISKASADQRAGRAGRTAAGACLRLWSEREHGMLRDFESPEIARVDLSQILLQLIAWGEHDLRAFPWFEAPPPAALDQALLLLERIDALDKGRLTELGKKMAALPLQPRTARLLLEGQMLGHGKRSAVCAALLEERDPIRRAEQKASAEHMSDSDVLDRLEAIESFAGSGLKHSQAGELMSGTARQIIRAGEQLARLINESDASGDSLRIAGSKDCSSEEAMLRAILAAFPDRVCRRREPAGRRALMVGGRGVRLADESAVGDCEMFVAVELLDSGQPESLARQASRIEKSWLPKAHLSESIDTAYDADREKVMAVRRLRYFGLVIDELIVQLPLGFDAAAVLAEAALANFELDTLVNEEASSYMVRLRWLRHWQPELDLPDFGTDPWQELLPEWCAGSTSIQDLRSAPLAALIQARLTPQQVSDVERFAPESIVVPSGRRVKLEYGEEKPPVLAVRIQEMFGLADTPRIANSRVPVLLHLLAPNNRVQQITSDLASFWKTTYAEVKKDLRSRYPKHAWPDDPLKAQPESRPRRNR